MKAINAEAMAGTYTEFYQANQRQGIGTRINDAGYTVMSNIDLTGKRILEIGAGDIRHIKYCAFKRI